MLYYLFRYLNTFGIADSGMWTYISFRSLMAFIFALVISLWFGKYFIRWMNEHQSRVEEKKFDASVDAVAAKRASGASSPHTTVRSPPGAARAKKLLEVVS